MTTGAHPRLDREDSSEMAERNNSYQNREKDAYRSGDRHGNTYGLRKSSPKVNGGASRQNQNLNSSKLSTGSNHSSSKVSTGSNGRGKRIDSVEQRRRRMNAKIGAGVTGQRTRPGGNVDYQLPAAEDQNIQEIEDKFNRLRQILKMTEQEK